MLNIDLLFVIMVWGLATFLIGCGFGGIICNIIERVTKNGKK